MNNSLGDSWADADYTSGGGSSVYSAEDTASEVEREDSDEEILQQKQPTSLPPLSSRPKQQILSRSEPVTRAKSGSLKTVKKPTKGQSQILESSRIRQRTARNVHKTRGGESAEPSFVMPSFNIPNHGNSPQALHAKSSQARQRMTPQHSAQEPRASFSRTGNNRPSTSRGAPKVIEKREQEELGPWYYLNLAWKNFIWPVCSYLLEIVSYAMRHFIKPILGVVLGIGMLVFGMQTVSGVVRNSLTNAILRPVCAIPGSSFIPVCRDSGPKANFEELINIQGHFEDIVDASKEVSTLPSSIKDSELVIRDLRTLVKYSTLPSRRELDNEFDYFILTAREASQDLARYNSHIGAAMDRVIATNQWTMNVLEGISENEASTGAVHKALSALTRSFSAPPPTLQERIFDQYIQHVSKNKDEIDTLIARASALLWILNNLEDRLSTIHAIALNDGTTLSAKNDELLSSLWTKLGGNRRDVQANAKSTNLLRNIITYRRKAVVHVSDTLVKLQAIQAELENLREGVAAPELLGPHALAGALPIEYHIDLIGRAVKRLQETRGQAFRVEVQNYMKVMRGGGRVREVEGPGVPVRGK